MFTSTDFICIIKFKNISTWLLPLFLVMSICMQYQKMLKFMKLDKKSSDGSCYEKKGGGYII